MSSKPAQKGLNSKAILVDYKALKPRAGCPLDYSFNNLTSLKDLRDATPRSGVPKIQRTLTEAAPAQQQKDNISSAAATTRASVGLQEPGVAESQRSHKHQTANYNATSVRLCNNQLANLEGLEPALAAVLDDPAELEWLDVSYNQLRSIEEVVLHFPKLQVLYLHSNQLTKLSEVRRLAGLVRLTKLTLHGNPIEEAPNYRLYVAAVIPTLKTLDFVPITKVERDTVHTRFQKEEDFRRALKICGRQIRGKKQAAARED